MIFMQKMRTVWTLLLVVTAAMASASPAAGQQFFETSKVEVDISRYTSVFDCMAAVDRVAKTLRAEEFHATGVWADTMPYDPNARLQPWPAAVGETARTCVTSTAADADTAGVDVWDILANLYLHAGMEDSARAVVERRLAAVEPDSTEELRGLLTDVLFLFNGHGVGTGIKPSRLEIGDDIVLDHIGRLPNLETRLNVYMQMVVTGGEDVSGDNEMAARTRRNLARMRAQLDSLTQRDVDRMVEQGGMVVGLTTEDVVNRLEGLGDYFYGLRFRLDSLRVSTEAYARATRNVWSRAYAQPPEAYDRPAGKRAPRLEGDVWLGCEQDPCESYPRPGRVSLVVFHTPETTRSRARERALPGMFSPGGGCVERAVPLRRLQDRFPELDIVVVARTWGHYSYVKKGVTPEREAELMYECFKSHGLDRVVVTMTETPGWRLPDPDGRWVEQPMANWTNYSFGGIWPDNDRMVHGSDLIVDQEGDVIHAVVAGRVRAGWVEELFAEIIQILLEREKGTT